jgi:hypothetical protein
MLNELVSSSLRRTDWIILDTCKLEKRKALLEVDMKTRYWETSKWQSFPEELIAGYDQFLRENTHGRDTYFINFMFNPLPGRTQSKIEQMRQEVSRVHDILTRHIVRKPNSRIWAHLRPIFIGCPDLPVAKNHRTERLKDVKINDGLHFNVNALVPSYPCVLHPGMNQHRLVQKQSRLRVPLDEHFAQNERLYLTDKLRTIHLTPITQGTMADYTLKNVKKGRVDPDDILIRK